MPKLTVTICFWVLYFELTIISFAALLRVEAAGLFRSAPSWIHLPVLMSLFVTDLLILRQRVLCSDILHSLCCDCAVSVLTLCRSVLCSSGIWFWEVQCSSCHQFSTDPTRGRLRAELISIHFKYWNLILAYLVTLSLQLHFSMLCVYMGQHTHPHTYKLKSSDPFSVSAWC